MKTKILKPLVVFTIIILLGSISFILYTRVFNKKDTSKDETEKTNAVESVVPEETIIEEQEEQSNEESNEEDYIKEETNKQEEVKVEEKKEEKNSTNNNNQNNSNQQSTKEEIRTEPKQENTNNNQNTSNNNNNNQNSSTPEKTDLETAIEEQQKAGWPVTYYNGHTITSRECYSIGEDLQDRQETTYVTQFECKSSYSGSAQVAGLIVYYTIDGIEHKDDYNSYINKIR